MEVSLFLEDLISGVSSGDKRTLRLGGLVIVEVCMHKFGDFCKSVLHISLFYDCVMFWFIMQLMNGYVMVHYANVRLINCSVTHVIAN